MRLFPKDKKNDESVWKQFSHFKKIQIQSLY